MDSNLSGAPGETIWGPLPGSLNPSGASGGLRSGADFDLPFPPANVVKILWIEMACTGVPHIVLHISCSTRTFWGHFRPSKESWNCAMQGHHELSGKSDENKSFWPNQSALSIMIELCYFSLDQWEIRIHLLWGKCFNNPHNCDPHLNQTKWLNS